MVSELPGEKREALDGVAFVGIAGVRTGPVTVKSAVVGVLRERCWKTGPSMGGGVGG